MKIYVGAEEALREKERGDETQFTIKIGGKTSLGPNQSFRFVKFHSQLRIWCPIIIIPKLAILVP